MPAVVSVTIKPQDTSVIDSESGIYFYKTPDFIKRCRIDEVSKNIRFNRAGVIPVFYNGTEFNYCLGVDKKYNDLTDFGGGVNLSEEPLEAALRELKEESLNIFDFFDVIEKIRTSSYAIYDSKGIIVFFVLVKVDMLETQKMFLTRFDNESENSSIVWLKESEFQELLSSDKSDKYHLYDRVKNVISYVGGLIGP
jgi:ADP-ribose pyrophosphatase YjhB (NUDIX family)